MIITIGEELYVALAKGGMVDWGGHLLIIPIGHYESTRHLLKKSSESQSLLDEMDTMKKRLAQVYKARGESVVCFEMYGGDQGQGTPLQHMHIQMIPIPLDIEADVGAIFEQEAEMFGLELVPDGQLPESLTMPYCRVELPTVKSRDGKTSCQVFVFVPTAEKMREYHAILEESRASGRRPPRLINLQFGRHVVAQLVGVPDKADWKNCLQTAEEEEAMAKNMRQLIGE